MTEYIAALNGLFEEGPDVVSAEPLLIREGGVEATRFRV